MLAVCYRCNFCPVGLRILLTTGFRHGKCFRYAKLFSVIEYNFCPIHSPVNLIAIFVSEIRESRCRYAGFIRFSLQRTQEHCCLQTKRSASTLHAGQIQWKRFCPNSEHYPPFLQGLLEQGRNFNAVESRKKGHKITFRCNNWD